MAGREPSFNDLMSEQLAESLQRAEVASMQHEASFFPEFSAPIDDEFDEDYLLALQLQEEEFQRLAERQADDFHSPSKSNSKVSVGEHPSEAYFLRNSFSSNSTFSPKPPSRPKGDEPLPDESLASMVKLKGRSPAKKVLEDELSVSPSKGIKREVRHTKPVVDTSTADGLDGRSRFLLMKMQNKGVFSGISGVIAQGKEATVHHARATEEGLISEYAVKVYKTTKVEFRDREKYITGEWRFRHQLDLGNRQKTIKLWAEKEVRNLKRLQAASILCPTPIALKSHIVIMEFIGKNGFPSPQLGQLNASPDVFQDLYWETVRLMQRMYSVSHLVHSDLGSYNILVHNGRLILIDLAQAVTIEHPSALEFLRRDCFNITTFFKHRGVSKLLTTRELYEFVCDERLTEKKAEVKIQEYMETLPPDRVLSREEQISESVWLKLDLPRDLNDIMDPIFVEHSASQSILKSTLKSIYREGEEDSLEDESDDYSDSAEDSDLEYL